MSIFKCKMCGGDLEINEGITIAECEYCGTKQTVPKAMDENLQNLFNRANTLRIKSEFDKAEKLYEKIIQADTTQSEAYWGLILCKYGIEYVDDPATFKKIPTCHRASYDSIIADDDYKSALENSDSNQRALYEEQAKEIDRIQKEILALAQKEETYDVFICYKETDADGKRTQDSVIANDIYYQLTSEGFKVFYAAITLEGKLGSAYEPIIFAALNSAKVMLSIGTKPEYFNAVWVKNEWSRFLKIIKNDRSKLLIPCYKDMDAYELPEEFAHLQAQDMGKIGFINDLVRGIKKVIEKDAPKQNAVVKETVVTNANASVAPLLKRAFMFLEDGEFDSADEYCEKVLDADPENAMAYLGKLMVELKVKKQENLKNCAEPFDGNNNYQKAMRFADDELKATLGGYIEFINTRNENARCERIYDSAKSMMLRANSEISYKEAANKFESISDYKDSAELAKECYEKAEITRKDEILSEGKSLMKFDTIFKYERAINYFESISGWKDADEQLASCQKKINEIKAEEEADRIELERIAKRNKKIAIIITPIVCVIIAFIIVLITVIIPTVKYNAAVALMDAGKYTEAAFTFGASGNYSDAKKQAATLWNKITVRKTISAGWYHTVGLKSDGTVVATGSNGNGECNVSSWKDIVAISAGGDHTVGLKSDGTVVAVGSDGSGQCDVKYWKDIVAISAGNHHTVGLKSDGTVVAVGGNSFGQCSVSAWKDIVAISAGSGHTVGLKSDGTVVAVGFNGSGQCNVSAWKDIVAISAGGSHTVGLKSDGTVVAVGNNRYCQCNVSSWKDIVAISAGGSHTVGLTSDGTVVTVGNNGDGQRNVYGWKDIKVPAK